MKFLTPFCLLLLVYQTNSICQIKTYSGKFDGVIHRNFSAKETGKATYQYYENKTFDRTFHGNFSFIGETVNIKGAFKDGIKVGKWKINSDNKVDHMIGPQGFFCKVKLNTNIFGSFDSGLFNGEWIYNYSNSASCITPPSWKKHIDIKSIAHFRNGVFIGKIKYESSTDGDYELDEGQFDENGFFDGIWTTKRGSIKTIKKYKHGIYYFILEQNTTTGEKIKYTDNTEWMNSIFNNYDKNTGHSVVDNLCYSMDTIKGWNYRIWLEDRLVLENDQMTTNPLYNIEGSQKPECYEIKVIKCNRFGP